MSEISEELKHAIPHHPVLYHEIIQALRPGSGGRYVDGTVGAGGHAWGILQASAPDGLLLGLDIDPQALALAQHRLAEFGKRVTLIQASYVNLPECLKELNWRDVNGIVLDLGLSSMQLKDRERGFSFQSDAPLDMRFDPRNPVRAADLVNRLAEDELVDLLVRYGEEHHARQIARAIVAARPLSTSGELATLIARVVRRGAHERLHPATRTFQALRIAVNRELEAIEKALPLAVSLLSPAGRLAVISFHSLEDRLVKQFFRRESKDCLCPPRQPVCTCGHRAILREITPRPIRPQDEEITANPRSRSARLRVAERL